MAVRVVLIHAVAVAMPPVADAFERLWPEADCVNILDDSLSRDRERDDDLTPVMNGRIGALARYGVEIGAEGVLFTCSAFGEAIEAAAAALPVVVLKPNEAMFEVALARGRSVGMLATFAPSVASMEREFRETAAREASDATIESHCVPEAMAALKRGDGALHDLLLAQAASRLQHCEVILLAQFSTTRAEAAVMRAVERPVLTSPGSAVTKPRSMLTKIAPAR